MVQHFSSIFSTFFYTVSHILKKLMLINTICVSDEGKKECRYYLLWLLKASNICGSHRNKSALFVLSYKVERSLRLPKDEVRGRPSVEVKTCAEWRNWKPTSVKENNCHKKKNYKIVVALITMDTGQRNVFIMAIVMGMILLKENLAFLSIS